MDRLFASGLLSKPELDGKEEGLLDLLFLSKGLPESSVECPPLRSAVVAEVFCTTVDAGALKVAGMVGIGLKSLDVGISLCRI